MSLYPSLEDMKVDNMARAQMNHHQMSTAYAAPPLAAIPSAPVPSSGGTVYPALGEYMGLELSSDVIALNMPEYQVQPVSFLGKKTITYLITQLKAIHVMQ